MPNPHATRAVGLDVGLSSFLTTSNGEKVENPRFFRESAQKLAERQRALARKRRGSNSRKRAKVQVSRIHLHIRNQRLDFARKLAKHFVSRYDLICVEDLQIRNMVQNHHLSKSISDVAWSVFFHCLGCKAEEAGIQFVKVDPKGTSQECYACGRTVPKALSCRRHVCSCGASLDRDHNAGLNILRRGLRLVTASTHPPKGGGVLAPEAFRSTL